MYKIIQSDQYLASPSIDVVCYIYFCKEKKQIKSSKDDLIPYCHLQTPQKRAKSILNGTVACSNYFMVLAVKYDWLFITAALLNVVKRSWA